MSVCPLIGWNVKGSEQVEGEEALWNKQTQGVVLDLCGFKGLLLLFRLSASYLIYFAPLPSGEK